ncbi:uncharacterized protein MAM_03142 [Metarhizium album ARSEF 1941]|uniref:Uncharacterized protein n=1 Tax=Metarhizium album (strain ARSEF 1941) TaxID=1081103 RepID=A0A0B2X0S6_METAS|nr:uncharacterized protein MAM_03142 [Metarhizium album ARSEF 1941]KHN98680.1 hypothetical protein MAM_03142 [Metarhizium album ARSEF 1941]
MQANDAERGPGFNDDRQMFPIRLFLRWIFGYGDKNEECPSTCRVAPWPSVQPTTSFCKPEYSLKRIRFMSIDIDELVKKNGVVQSFHIGVSTLDMQTLQQMVSCGRNSTDVEGQVEQLIKSHHWIVEDAEYYLRGRGNVFFFNKPTRMAAAPPDRAGISRHVTAVNRLPLDGRSRKLAFGLCNCRRCYSRNLAVWNNGQVVSDPGDVVIQPHAARIKATDVKKVAGTMRVLKNLQVKIHDLKAS